MVRCPHCRVSLADGARYCLECGKPVGDAVDLGETAPGGLERFVGIALGEATMLDPGPAGGPTGLLRAARASAGDGGPLPDARIDLGAPKDPPAAPPATPPAPPEAAEPLASPPPAPPSATADTADPVPAVKTRRPGDPAEPGEVIDGYVIEEEIGRGGMGRVYLATHEVTGQQVAMKMLKPQVATGRVRERFVNEARLLARLDHPNLVPLSGFVDLPRGLFIVMPYVRGISLEAMLRRQGRLALDVAAPLFAGICAAVHHIHQRDLLHRDLKPGNVIVQSDGQPRLTDFGIAREIGSDGLTATGLVVGTAEYIAPELANGTLRDDPRSDQYSLGCMLYHMLVGQPPFRHPNIGELLVQHIQEPPPPPRTVAPDIPQPVEAVMLRALAKDPAERFADVAALADALDRAVQLARDPGAVATVALGAAAELGGDPPPRRIPWLGIGLALAAAYAVAAGAWWWLSRA